MRLEEALGEIAAECASKTALEVCGASSISFAELVDRSDAAACFLRQSGVTPGSRVGILSRHDPEAVVLFWAVFKVSAIVVWLNDDAGSETLSTIIDDADPIVIFAQSDRHMDMLHSVCGSRDGLMRISEISSSAKANFSVDPTGDEAGPDAVAAIVYTSGSSGKPKGVCLTHRNLLTVSNAVIQHMPITSDDSYLMVVPMHYVHGLMQLLVHALAGATVFCTNSFAFPRKIVELLRSTGVTGFSGVPFHFNSLVSRGNFLEAELPSLKWLTVTGGKLANSRVIEIMDSFPKVDFHIAYGQTECAPRATALDPGKLRSKPDSVGSAIPGVNILLFGDDGQPVSAGEVGEVAVEGANVMAGYWRDAESTAKALDSEGRLLTGDLGRFDEDGDLFLVGRKSEMIKAAGERIIPEELEKVLTSHNFVDDAVVVGVTDSMYGQRVVAHLLLSDRCESMDNNEVIAGVRSHCLEAVPFARAPREYNCWKAFPMKSNGKPDRQEIVRTSQAGD
ncbi:MAG: acyl--CoA ligase [Gammaproteobacteria bacterium]|nr:acyl--CoA ligase [Gammaproteobacteria bacterium]